VAPAGVTGDMFLFIKGAKAGVIKGEAHDADHEGEIDILSWSWGMQAHPSLGGGSATARATIRELKVVKRIDRASTALMSSLRTNELISKAVLTLRKSGKAPLEYFKITIEQGRVIGVSIEAGDRAHSPEVFEEVSFSFNKITVEYTPQGKDGLGGGATSFTDEWQAQA
jgi:type VI secretion system secreted protein Hcp